MNPGIPEKDTSSWMVFLGVIPSNSFLASLAPIRQVSPRWAAPCRPGRWKPRTAVSLFWKRHGLGVGVGSERVLGPLVLPLLRVCWVLSCCFLVLLLCDLLYSRSRASSEWEKDVIDLCWAFVFIHLASQNGSRILSWMGVKC